MKKKKKRNGSGVHFIIFFKFPFIICKFHANFFVSLRKNYNFPDYILLYNNIN